MRYLVIVLLLGVISNAHAQAPATLTNVSMFRTSANFLPPGIPKLPRSWKGTYQVYQNGTAQLVVYKNGNDSVRTNYADTHIQNNVIVGSFMHFQWSEVS